MMLGIALLTGPLAALLSYLLAQRLREGAAKPKPAPIPRPPRPS